MPSTGVASAAIARDQLDCCFFDYLTAVDELDDGFSVVLHVARRRPGRVDVRPASHPPRPRGRRGVDCVCGLFAGAGWHERETHEMFGIEFAGHGELDDAAAPRRLRGPPAAQGLRAGLAGRQAVAGCQGAGRVRRRRGAEPPTYPPARRPRPRRVAASPRRRRSRRRTEPGLGAGRAADPSDGAGP